jgi:RHS repeat-associated protein
VNFLSRSLWAALFLLTGAGVVSAQPANVVVEYYHTDALGSVRAVTDANGALVAQHEYFPFGEENSPPSPSVRFTGKERDAETQFDYFGARYYSSRSGRFMAVDPVVTTRSATLDPQRWNRYAYVQNNPLRYVDPDGRCSAPSGIRQGQTGFCIEAFIAQDWFKGVGRGDARGFSGTNPDLTARSRIKIVVNGDGKIVSSAKESARSGVLIKGLGLKGDTVGSAAALKKDDGSVSLHVDLWGRNGEAFLAPVAPDGVLDGHFNFDISKNGLVTFVKEGSSATSFPSWAIYAYGPDGSVKALWEEPENVIDDLKKPPKPIK